MPAQKGTVQRPWQIYALTMLWAIKGVEELFRGVIGPYFFIAREVAEGRIRGFGFQLAVQSLVFSAILTAGSLYVMGALWLGRRAARPWGVAIALVGEILVLANLITRPPEFGGTAPLVRTVLTASIVNLSIIAFLLFDTKLAAFLGSTRLVGWWVPRR